MSKIEVWAPKVQTLEIAIHEKRLSLQKKENGWWAIDNLSIQHGDDYALYLDNKGPISDPKSSFQPHGVLGISQWVDHNRFKWTDQSWEAPAIESAIIYELHVGTFTPEGTFEGIIPHLDYLVDLGITHVELMPIAEFSGNRGWGYDGVNLYAPHHAYGGPEKLKQLVDICHQKGLAVILDVVYNHLGPVGNYLNLFGPYFTDRYATPWGDALNFDGANSTQVRDYFIENALMWLRDYHFDGLRLDAVHAIIDTSAIHFLEELAARVSQFHPKIVLIAESDLNDCRILNPVEKGGYGLKVQWNEDFHHALHAYFTGEKEGYYKDFGQLKHLAKILRQGLYYDGCYSEFRQKVHGRPPTNILGNQYIGYIQNHDQIGNRALGERIGHLITSDQMKIAAALVMTAPFVPMIFQGEEWAASSPFLYFTNHEDKSLGDAVYQGRQKEFAHFLGSVDNIPHPQEQGTFDQSKLQWDELKESGHHEIYEWYRSLIHLRKHTPDLNESSFANVTVEYDEANEWLILRRGIVLVICNFSESPQVIPTKGTNQLILASQKWNHVEMPGHSVAIYVSNYS